jgi:hypothetical protein
MPPRVEFMNPGFASLLLKDVRKMCVPKLLVRRGYNVSRSVNLAAEPHHGFIPTIDLYDSHVHKLLARIISERDVRVIREPTIGLSFLDLHVTCKNIAYLQVC